MSNSTFVFILIGVASLMMASNRVRFDVIALLVVLALMLSGVLSVGEALSGFGSPVVIMVASLLIVGEMLDRTGVAHAVGDFILKKGGSSETRLLILILSGAALLGSMMSSTAIVAIFIPIVLRIAAETNLNASRLLLPMSYAALISGMLTLIATTPNIVVHDELVSRGYDGFGFFSFTPVGLVVLVVAIAYILIAGRHLIRCPEIEAPKHGRRRSSREIWSDFRVDERIESLQVISGSQLAGVRIGDSALEGDFDVRVIGVLRGSRRSKMHIAIPGADFELRVGDLLLVLGEEADRVRASSTLGLSSLALSEADRTRWSWELGAAAVLIHPDSHLIGKSLREGTFRSRFNLHVAGLRRDGKSVDEFEDVKLMASDTLLVTGPWSRINQLESRNHDFVVLEIPAEQMDVVPAYSRLPVALLILTVMVLLTVFDVVPLTAAVLMAALAAVLTRCLTMEDAYRSIPLSSLVLVAGMLPLANALESTGGTRLIVDSLMTNLGGSGPMVMMSAIFFLTAGLSLFLSNTAAAVLVAPIAISAATALDVSPYPFAVAVIIAASAAFVTPVSTPVVTLVVAPGRYAFMDFVKVGLPLLILVYLVTILVAPLIFPFKPV